MIPANEIVERTLEELSLIARIAKMEEERPSLSFIKSVYHNLFGEENVSFDKIGYNFETSRPIYTPRVKDLSMSDIYDRIKSDPTASNLLGLN